MPARNPQKHAGMLQSAARIVLLPSWVIAIAIMLKGYADVGDGFSAGVIAALGVLLQGLAFGVDELEQITISRIAPVLSFVGLGLALLTAFVPILFGENLFTHWPGMNEHAVHFGALEFITPVLFDIGVFLIVYGFCVGGLHAIAREEVRQVKLRDRGRYRRSTAPEGSLAEESGETPS